MQNQKENVLTVFFCGTGVSHESDDGNLFNVVKHCIYDTFNTQIPKIKQTDIGLETINCPSEHQYMFFDGCQVIDGFMGAIFGTGLDRQVAAVVAQIDTWLKQGYTIKLNGAGHSRGAVALLMLMLALKHVPATHLSSNIVLIEPVPGNLITTALVDPFKISLAQKVNDLRGCAHLKNVLALYGAQTDMPSIACHAALQPTYPSTAQVREVLLPANHVNIQTANFNQPNRTITTTPFSLAAIKLMLDFLNFHGSSTPNNLAPQQNHLNRTNHTPESAMITNYGGLKFAHDRYFHGSNVRLIHINPNAKYFNAHHMELEDQPFNENNVLVQFAQHNGPIAMIKRFNLNHPLTMQFIKWSLITSFITSVTFATIALTIGLPLTVLSVSSTLMCGMLIAASTGLIWYGVAKPTIEHCASRLFYPAYRELQPQILNPPTN